MIVQVKDRLLSVMTYVGDESVPVFRNAEFFRNPLCRKVNVANGRSILGLNVVRRRDVLFRD
jgi:hypothetical protein